ncbi:MAG: helix-turn-helix domain-containing protein [Actinomycetes bacterium]|jgi:DNA-binding HxlR family transcriptional regulator|nr:MAG: transcriptional regulator [Actinomycetota bacterium]
MQAAGPAASCGVRDVLDRVGDKWSIAVVNQLRPGRRRFSQLLRAIDGISRRMLTATLRGLERDGLVRRTVYPEVPPRVEYELTELGHALLDRTWPLMTWAIEHREEIDRARRRYDGAR